MTLHETKHEMLDLTSFYHEMACLTGEGESRCREAISGVALFYPHQPLEEVAASLCTCLQVGDEASCILVRRFWQELERLRAIASLFAAGVAHAALVAELLDRPLPVVRQEEQLRRSSTERQDEWPWDDEHHLISIQGSANAGMLSIAELRTSASPVQVTLHESEIDDLLAILLHWKIAQERSAGEPMETSEDDHPFSSDPALPRSRG